MVHRHGLARRTWHKRLACKMDMAQEATVLLVSCVCYKIGHVKYYVFDRKVSENESTIHVTLNHTMSYLWPSGRK